MGPEPTKSSPRTPVAVLINQEFYVTALQTALEIDSVHFASTLAYFFERTSEVWTAMYLSMRRATPSVYLDLCEENCSWEDRESSGDF